MTRTKRSVIWLLPCVLALSACATHTPAGVQPVTFDVDRYAGRWYEVARIDHFFEKGLVRTSADYSRNADGTIKVVNRGFNPARQQWKEVMDTNLSGVFNMTHPLWNGMRERKFGRIINISSINGQKGQFAQANYSAAKAGDLGFTKALAQEGARAGITVNAICPGYIGTEMVRAIDEKVLNERIIPQIPVGRLGEPEEIARAVVFLASGDAGFITGSTISANGGQFFV